MDRNPTTACPTRLPGILLAGACAFALTLHGCAPAAPDPAATLPASDSIPGWAAAGEPQSFDEKTLFHYINGQSEYFFTYAFEALAVGRYADAGGATITVEVWRTATTDDAFGLFSGSKPREPAEIGNAVDAWLEPGSRVYLWQDRFYVVIGSSAAGHDDALLRFAEAVSAALPPGGSRPSLVARLPAGAWNAQWPIFFRSEMAIQNELWLGGDGILNLSPESSAALAVFETTSGRAKLLLAQYPDDSLAAAAREALAGGTVKFFRSARAEGLLLGAVFGAIGEAEADALLATVDWRP